MKLIMNLPSSPKELEKCGDQMESYEEHISIGQIKEMKKNNPIICYE